MKKVEYLCEGFWQVQVKSLESRVSDFEEEIHWENMKKVGSNEIPNHALKEQQIWIELGKIILTLEKENSMLKDEVRDLE